VDTRVSLKASKSPYLRASLPLLTFSTRSPVQGDLDAWSKERALEYIQSQKGKHFDPQVVEAFLQILK